MTSKQDRIEAPTRTGRINTSVVAALIVLLLVAIFIAQNSQSISIKFLGWNGHISLGLSMLISAVAGGLIVTLFGSARLLQLRHRAKKAHVVEPGAEEDHGHSHEGHDHSHDGHGHGETVDVTTTAVK